MTGWQQREKDAGPPAREPTDVPAANPRNDEDRGVAREQELGTGPAVRSAFRDGVVWALVGAAIGAAVALPLAFVMLGDLDVVPRMQIVAAVGAVAGAAVGFAMAAGRSDDEADNGLGARDAQAEEDAGYEATPARADDVGLPWQDDVLGEGPARSGRAQSR